MPESSHNRIIVRQALAKIIRALVSVIQNTSALGGTAGRANYLGPIYSGVRLLALGAGVSILVAGQTATKEYIRLGGRVIAFENSTSGSSVAVPPQAIQGAPATSTSPTEVITLVGQDSNGAQNIKRMYFAINATASVPVNSCHGFYSRPDNGLYLFNDALTAVAGPLIPGTVGTLFNGQCVIDGLSTNVLSSGNRLTLNLGVARKPGFRGNKNLYLIVQDLENTDSGWFLNTAWNLSAGPPQAVSGSPASSTNAIQTFRMTARDPDGYQDISRIYFLVNTSTSIPQNTCHGFYSRSDNNLYLYNDALTSLQSATLGSANVLENGQCKVHPLVTAIASNGNDMVLDLGMELKQSYINPAKSVYFIVQDNALTNSAWRTVGSWSVASGGAPVTPTADSVTPGLQTLNTVDFVFTATDGNGYQDIERMYFSVNTTPTIPAGTCHGWYERSQNAFYLFDIGLTIPDGPLMPGSQEELSNGLCSISGLGSSASPIGANSLRVTMRLSRTANSGAKNVYLVVTDSTGRNSTGASWPYAISWNPTPANTAPTLGPVTPNSGTLSGLVTLSTVYSDTD